MEFILEVNRETSKIEKIKQKLTTELLRKLIVDYFSKEEKEELVI